MRKILIFLAVLTIPAVVGHAVAPTADDLSEIAAPTTQGAEEPARSEYEVLTSDFFQEVIDLSMLEHCGFIKAGGQLLSARWQVLQSNFLTHHGYMPKGIERFTEDFERARRNGNELGADPAICRTVDQRHVQEIRWQISMLTGIPEQALHR